MSDHMSVPPDDDRALVDRLGIVRHQRRLVHGLDDSRAAAGPAGAGTVEGELLGSGTVELPAAGRAGDFLHGCDRKRWRAVVPIGAAVTRKPGEHEPQTIEQFGKRSECTADAGNPRALPKRKRRRHISDILHIRAFRLRHPPASVGGEGFQVSAGSLRIQHAERERGFPRAGDPGDHHDLVQWDIDINVLQVMDLRAPHLDVSWRHLPLSDFTGHDDGLFAFPGLFRA